MLKIMFQGQIDSVHKNKTSKEQFYSDLEV